MHDIQLFIRQIPGQIERHQPDYLIDALYRECPFYLEFIRSAEALVAVLKINLKDAGCGPEMIDRGDFVIEDAGTQTSIDLTQDWDLCYYPGQRVAMSMVFRQTTWELSCPGCTTVYNQSAGEEITFTICKAVFGRIEAFTTTPKQASYTATFTKLV
ncbi:hypothetical protein BDV12DRAFT_100259 [Aspergillus spectabilis]